MCINSGSPQDPKILTGFNNVTTSNQAGRTTNETEVKINTVAKKNIPTDILETTLSFSNKASFMRTGNLLKNIALFFGKIFNTKNYQKKMRKLLARKGIFY